MPETLGLVEASVEAHRLVEGFLLCTIERGAARSEAEERRDRTQLRAADGQENDIVDGMRLMWCRGRVYFDGKVNFLDFELGFVSPDGLCAKSLSGDREIYFESPSARTARWYDFLSTTTKWTNVPN